MTIDDILNSKIAKKEVKVATIIPATSAPAECQLCNVPTPDTFVDGRTRMGPWGYMCLPCHRTNGVGLGLGKGQLYEKQTDGNFLKVQG